MAAGALPLRHSLPSEGIAPNGAASSVMKASAGCAAGLVRPFTGSVLVVYLGVAPLRRPRAARRRWMRRVGQGTVGKGDAGAATFMHAILPCSSRRPGAIRQPVFVEGESDAVADPSLEGGHRPPDTQGSASSTANRPVPRAPLPERSILLELALYALRETRTREDLLDQATRITAAALGGNLAKVLEHVPAGAKDFLVTAGFGWDAADSVVGALHVPGGADASPTGRAEATGHVQSSAAGPASCEGPDRVADELARAGVRSALDVSIPRVAGSEAGRSHGVLQADSRRESAFGTDDEALLQQIAGVLGVMLDAEDRRRAAAEAAAAVQALLQAEAEHRIANSLQGVAATLALQARLAGDDPRVAVPLRAAAARIAAAGAVHRHLYRAAAAGTVSLR